MHRICGFAGHSTCAELPGAIIALSAYGHIHLASDRIAFVDQADRLLDLIASGSGPNRPWKLCSDGSLWSHFHRAKIAKGPVPFRTTRVKGHADEGHILRGIATLANKLGNDEADRVPEGSWGGNHQAGRLSAKAA